MNNRAINELVDSPQNKVAKFQSSNKPKFQDFETSRLPILETSKVGWAHLSPKTFESSNSKLPDMRFPKHDLGTSLNSFESGASQNHNIPRNPKNEINYQEILLIAISKYN